MLLLHIHIVYVSILFTKVSDSKSKYCVARPSLSSDSLAIMTHVRKATILNTYLRSNPNRRLIGGFLLFPFTFEIRCQACLATRSKQNETSESFSAISIQPC